MTDKKIPAGKPKLAQDGFSSTNLQRGLSSGNLQAALNTPAPAPPPANPPESPAPSEGSQNAKNK